MIPDDRTDLETARDLVAGLIEQPAAAPLVRLHWADRAAALLARVAGRERARIGGQRLEQAEAGDEIVRPRRVRPSRGRERP